MTPWLSGSASVPNSACGLSASMPNRPSVRIGAAGPASEGSSSV